MPVTSATGAARSGGCPVRTNASGPKLALSAPHRAHLRRSPVRTRLRAGADTGVAGGTGQSQYNRTSAGIAAACSRHLVGFRRDRRKAVFLCVPSMIDSLEVKVLYPA